MRHQLGYKKILLLRAIVQADRSQLDDLWYILPRDQSHDYYHTDDRFTAGSLWMEWYKRDSVLNHIMKLNEAEEES